MQKASTTGAVGVGIHAIQPKAGNSPRRSPQQRADDDDESDMPERAPPPPGMGRLVDKTA
jgi:hypothetical protein